MIPVVPKDPDRMETLPAFCHRKMLRCEAHSPTPYFPMQNVEKMRLRISSAVVSPVSESSARSAS